MKYIKLTKRYITAFESIFNNLTVTREYKQGNSVKTKVIKVPIEFANAEKEYYYRKIQEDLTSVKPAMTYPRLAFEITKEELDNTRVINKYNYFKTCVTSAGGAPYLIEAPVPYTMKFSLYLYSDILDDAFEVAEKIKTFFNPNRVVNINLDLGLTTDMNLYLDSVQLEDSYEGELSKRRITYYKFDFTAKTMFYKIPTDTTGIVKHVDIDISDIQNDLKSKIEADVVPDSAAITDPHAITTTITEF